MHVDGLCVLRFVCTVCMHVRVCSHLAEAAFTQHFEELKLVNGEVNGMCLVWDGGWCGSVTIPHLVVWSAIC